MEFLSASKTWTFYKKLKTLPSKQYILPENNPLFDNNATVLLVSPSLKPESFSKLLWSPYGSIYMPFIPANLIIQVHVSGPDYEITINNYLLGIQSSVWD